MSDLLSRARRDRAWNEARPTVDRLTGWRSVLYYLYYRNRYFLLREAGMWGFNLLEIGLAAWLIGGLQARGLALAGRYVQLLVALWGGVMLAERILVGRYHAAKQPERVARTVATFIQLGAGVGVLLAVLLNALAPVLVAPGSGEDEWIVQLFRHRAIVLVPELVAGSWFMGAYTMARMYRPLSITFLVRLVAVVSNIILYPRWGVPVLVFNLYLPRLVDLGVTIWVSRRWAFRPNRVPALPLGVRPGWNAGLIREMAPFTAGRGLGVLFREGYGVVILQAVSWLLPQEMIFYVFFLQALSLFYLIPRRLGRSLFFDVSRLLVWNRLGVLKAYLCKIDRVAWVAGAGMAGICLAAGWQMDGLAGCLRPEQIVILRPLIYAMALFLLFHPQNEVWQSVRDAAGELRFNNWLLGITHYGIALPVNVWLLGHVGGKLQEVQSHGLDFVVVSHALLFVRILLVDGAMEGVRAVLSRRHGLRFQWAEASPMRVARSLMDSEQAYLRSQALVLGYSRDLADLWGERFLGGGETGLLSLPFWAAKVCGFAGNAALNAHGFGLIRLATGRASHAYWKPGGEGVPALLGRLRTVDRVCRVSSSRLLVFLPGAGAEELKRRVFEISSTVGIHLVDLAFAHSGEGRLASAEEIERWIFGPEQREKRRTASIPLRMEGVGLAWQAVSGLFSLPQGVDEGHLRQLQRLCDSWAMAEEQGLSMEAWASDAGAKVLGEWLDTDVVWGRPERWEAGDVAMREDMHLLQRVMRSMDRHRIPDFRRFLKVEANRLFPVFFRTHLEGVWVHEPVDQMEQSHLIRMAAAFYLWATMRSVGTERWTGRDGEILGPVFKEELASAQALQRETGIPFAHAKLVAVRHGAEEALSARILRKTFGSHAWVRKRRRKWEILVPGMEPALAETKWRGSSASRAGWRFRMR